MSDYRAINTQLTNKIVSEDLKRTKSGDFALENCVSLEDICENPELITNNLQQA